MRLRLLGKDPVIEKDLSAFRPGELESLNSAGYNIYYFPNGSSKNLGKKYLSANDVNVWEWVFVDCDLKDKIYPTKEAFLEEISKFGVKPTKIVDSGHGIHVYWRISDLDRNEYLQIQMCLIRRFKTDKSIWTITQLMRLPGFKNVKDVENPEDVKIIEENSNIYTTNDLLKCLPELTQEDEQKIIDHVNKYILGISPTKPVENQSTDLPQKFLEFIEKNPPLKTLFENPEDRSKADMKIANILQLAGYTKEEVYSVLSHTSKGKERGDSYVGPLVEKVFANPLSDNNISAEYLHCQAIANNDYAQSQKKKVILDYKLNKEYNRTLKDIERDKQKGVYSLKNTVELRRQRYADDIKMLKESIGNRLYCISDGLTAKVPLLGVELILIGACSGNGKTSSAANMITPLIEAGKKVLYISNEERGSDMIMRVACLKLGVNINDRNNWDTETWTSVEKEIAVLNQDIRLTIVDNYVGGTDLSSGNPVEPLDLTNLEAFESLLESVERDGFKFDLMILDYISKIVGSDNGEAEYQTLYKAIKFIEEWGKRTRTPSVVFTQLKDTNQDNPEGFQVRIPGAKKIFTAVTNAIEIVTDYENSTSEWVCHKLRYGERFKHKLRFHKGRYFDADNP